MKIVAKNIPALFLKNMGVRQTIAKNIFWLACSDMVVRALEFVLFIYIVKILSVAEFGKIAFALAFVSLFASLSDFGLSDIANRELAGNQSAEKEYPAIVSLRLLIGMLSFALIAGFSFAVSKNLDVLFLIWVFGAAYLIDSFLFIFFAFFRARQKMEFEAFVNFLRIFVLISAVSVVFLKNPSADNVGFSYLTASIASLIFVLSFFYFKKKFVRVTLNKVVFYKFLKLSWPVGAAALANAVLLSSDLVIMGYLNKLSEVGFYSISRKFVGLLIIPATFIYMSFYSALANYVKESKEKFQKVWNYYMKFMAITALFVTVGGFFLAQPLIEFIFGEGFAPAVFAIKILIFTAGINFINYPFILILIVSGGQIKYFLAYLVSACANVILNLILIPYYSLYGAAAASLISYIILFALSAMFAGYLKPFFKKCLENIKFA